MIHRSFLGKALLGMFALSALTACGVASTAPSSVFSDAPTSASANPSARETRDCAWLFRSDADVFNVLYPDRYATYWVAALAIPPGGRLFLEGRYPLARYFSFNLYNPRLEPIDALADVEIQPLHSGANPFAVGATRADGEQTYRVEVVAGPRPAAADRALNTLYSSQTVGPLVLPSPVALVIYRIYVTDQGRSLTGDVGLPELQLEMPGGQTLTGSAACSALDRLQPPSLAPVLNALQTPVPLLPNTAGFPRLQWLKFFDLVSAQANRFNATPLAPFVGGNLGQAERDAGGFASNIHNAYIYATAAQSLGNVVALTAQAPRAPRTFKGVRQMESGDLRYFSFCSNEANTQRYFDCVYDEQIPRQAGDRFVLAMSRPADRPVNATAECGVAWIDWGTSDQSLLIYRHMLPADVSQFPAAIQAIPGPPGLNESSVMGAFYPQGGHFDRVAFEALGCPVRSEAVRAALPP